MPLKLNDSAIRKHISLAKELKQPRHLTDEGQSGLRLRISSHGTSTWNLICRDPQGKMRAFPLGRYPDLGISDARTACRTLYNSVKGGADPIAQQRQARALARQKEADLTLQGLIELYAPHAPKSFARSQGMINLVYRSYLDEPLTSLSRQSLHLAGLNYPKKHAANLALATLHPAFTWANDSVEGFNLELLTLKKPHKVEAIRERVLSHEELKRILPILEHSLHGKAMKFLLLTATRLNQTILARWQEIDWQAHLWIIPKERVKHTNPTRTRRVHVVPLSTQAIALLKALAKGEHNRGDYIFSNRLGTPLSNWHKEAAKIHQQSNTENWTRHDLRRTSATNMADLGYHTDVIESALDHVIGSKISSTYNKSRYLPQVRKALQELADFYDQLVR